MANTENLKSYRKGQSGNPSGRPMGSRNVSTVLADMLGQIAPKVVVEASFLREVSKKLKSATIADAVAARIVYQGVVKGDSWALRELLDRTEGKAKQSVEISKRKDLEIYAMTLRRHIDAKREERVKNGFPTPTDDEYEEKIQQIAELNNLNAAELREAVAALGRDNPDGGMGNRGFGR